MPDAADDDLLTSVDDLLAEITELTDPEPAQTAKQHVNIQVIAIFCSVCEETCKAYHTTSVLLLLCAIGQSPVDC